MSYLTAYRCSDTECNSRTLRVDEDCLVCVNGHRYPFILHTQIPQFVVLPENTNAYTTAHAATINQNYMRWMYETFSTDDATLRRQLVSRLNLKPGMRVLVTGAGSGDEVPYIIEALADSGEIYAQDIAKEMLLEGAIAINNTFATSPIRVHWSISDATNLPFVDNYFDAAYHFGGINLYPDIGLGIAEMNRVVKPGGVVLFGDEGIGEWLHHTQLGKMLITNNPLYASVPPLALLPETARNVVLSWELENCFYVIQFCVADEPLTINFDATHAGKRGGSMRSRFYGKLEGVDPTLRDAIYADAERLGMSRVAYIEAALRSILANENTK